MSTWTDRFYALLADYLRQEEGLSEVDRVTSYYEDSYLSGGCETCAYTVHELEVSYVTYGGNEGTYKFEARLTDLFG